MTAVGRKSPVCHSRTGTGRVAPFLMESAGEGVPALPDGDVMGNKAGLEDKEARNIAEM